MRINHPSARAANGHPQSAFRDGDRVRPTSSHHDFLVDGHEEMSSSRLNVSGCRSRAITFRFEVSVGWQMPLPRGQDVGQSRSVERLGDAAAEVEGMELAQSKGSFVASSSTAGVAVTQARASAMVKTYHPPSRASCQAPARVSWPGIGCRYPVGRGGAMENLTLQAGRRGAMDDHRPPRSSSLRNGR
jgi:hypothetical protein